MSTPSFCSECGKPLEAGHRFCTNCGATTNIEANARTALTSDQTVLSSDQAQNSQPQATAFAGSNSPTASTMITPIAHTPGAAANPPVWNSEIPRVSGTNYSNVPTSGEHIYVQATDADVIPPPPPPDSFISTPQKAPVSPQYSPPLQTNGNVPTYAQTPKRSRGCLIASVILLLALVLGGAGGIYAITHNQTTGSSQSGNNSSSQQNTSGSGGSTPTSVATSGSNGSTPGTNGPTTVPLNLKFTYSSVDMTLVSVQQASSFADDTSAPQGGVRVTVKESNSTTYNASFLYSDVVRLIMPDATITSPSNEKNFEGPGAGISRDNWIDFAVASQNIDSSKLVLRFGSATQNQMNIPLASGADLSKYQSKTISPNSTFQYAGLDWTLTSAAESLSASGTQAATGMAYVTVALKAVNSSANNFSGLPTDYMRLQSGDSKSPPINDSTFPISVASQSSGTGTVIFLIPQGGTTFTLLLLAQQTSPPINAASVTLQIQ